MSHVSRESPRPGVSHFRQLTHTVLYFTATGPGMCEDSENSVSLDSTLETRFEVYTVTQSQTVHAVTRLLTSLQTKLYAMPMLQRTYRQGTAQSLPRDGCVGEPLEAKRLTTCTGILRRLWGWLGRAWVASSELEL